MTLNIRKDGTMKNLICLLMSFFMISCASVHPGKYGKSVREDGSLVKNTNSELLVSGDTDKALSSDFYKFI